MALRDRFDLITTQFIGQEQKTSLNAQQPYGGDFSFDTTYHVAAVRIDNYTNRWILFDSEGFVIPPFSHGFIVNLFVQALSLRFRSVRSPFGRPVINYTHDLNPKSVSAPFPTKCLISLYDEPQFEQQPQSLVRIDNAMIEPYPNLTQTGIDPGFNQIGAAQLGRVTENGWPYGGALALPVVASPLFHVNDQGGAANQQARAPGVSVGGSLAVVANTWTSIVDNDQPQAFFGGSSSLFDGFGRLLRGLLSVSAAGRLDMRDLFSPVQGSNGGMLSIDVAAHTPVPFEFGDAGYYVNWGTAPGINTIQFQLSVAGTVTYQLEYAAGQ